MTEQPIFLDPIFQERIWGGNKLAELFSYPLSNDKIGECWAISAHDNGSNLVRNGEYEGKTLRELWAEHKEVFGSPDVERFPLLVKILDAHDDLSIQVHPSDDYALEVENDLGKTECWYVLDCKKDAKLIYGHNASTKQELQQMIEQEKWSSLLKEIPIQLGDFFYVPSGTVHALCSGTIVLEIQQSSDVTYRLYDYDRLGQDGQKRELHIDRALDVITVPNPIAGSSITTTYEQGGRIRTLVHAEFFSAFVWEVRKTMSFNVDQQYVLASVIRGEGVLQQKDAAFPVKTGDHFILPYQYGEFHITGDVDIVVATPPESN